MIKKVFLISLLLVLTGCGKHQLTQNQASIITVTAQPTGAMLYFTSTVQPLKTHAVTAVYEGTVKQMFFEYGGNVRQGQLLFTIHSTQLDSDYQTALTDYLKAKKNYANDLVQMQTNEQLKKLQIISEEEYRNTKSASYDNTLSYQQAIYKLQTILNKTSLHPINLQQLQALDMQQINKMLPAHMNSYSVISPATGIALIPAKSTDNESANAAQPTVGLGSQIKNNQELLNVGDMSGICFIVKVDEVHINDIKAGQQAIITGDAFPAINLQGVVTHVDDQALNSDNSAAPAFPVKITVPNLSANEQQIIHVGMSAKVALRVVGPVRVQLPLMAVGENQGQAYVKKINSQTGKAEKVTVQTGSTSLDNIIITGGLKEGDKVLAVYGKD